MRKIFIQYYRIICLFALVFTSVTTVFSQEWNSARLSVLYGSNVIFNFNTVSKFKNGIELSDATRIGISMADSSKVGHTLEGFVLNFRAYNGQSNMIGDGKTLPLNYLRVKARSYMGLGNGTGYDYQQLTSGWLPLFVYSHTPWTNLNWTTHQLNLSFDCGIPSSSGGNGTLLGEESDYYTVEIEMELIPTGPGF